MLDQSATLLELPRYVADETPAVKIPRGKTLGPVTGVQVTPDGHIWVLHIAATAGFGLSTSRQNPRLPPVIEFDADGNFLQAWGGPDHLPRINGNAQWPQQEEMIYFDDEGTVWVFGANKQYDHAVQRFTRDGKLLLRIGEFGVLGNDESPHLLGSPTDAYHDVERREVYISDGYINHRIAVFNSDTGAFLRSWGAYGEKPPFSPFGPRTFSNPVHAIDLGPEGHLYVCDRKNDRVQVFDAIGRTDAKFVREIGVDVESPFGVIFNIVFTPDEKFMIMSDGSNSRLVTVDREAWRIVDCFPLPGRANVGMRSTVHKITSDLEGNLLFACGPRGIHRLRFEGVRACPPPDVFIGDRSGLAIPAHKNAFRASGAEFLAAAFQASGLFGTDQKIEITRIETCALGHAGQKLLVSIGGDTSLPSFTRDLFVKLSRDFSDPIRDELRKHEMDSEVAFARLSQQQGFPVVVPKVLFADGEQASHSAILVTERIAFGSGNIEPRYRRAADHQLRDPASYYRAIMRTLARLVVAEKAGALGDVEAIFPFDRQNAVVRGSLRYHERQVRERITRYADFAKEVPQLVPQNIRTPQFLQKLETEAMDFVEHRAEISQFLQSNSDFIALIHPQATIDNAWFWRDISGTLQCGLLDWGGVGRMSVAAALWNCLASASISTWDGHLGELLTLFAREVRKNGGPAFDVEELKLHVALTGAMVGLNYILDFAPKILLRLPAAVKASDPTDPLFDGNDQARCELNALLVFLNLWDRQDLGGCLARMRREFAEAALC